MAAGLKVKNLTEYRRGLNRISRTEVRRVFADSTGAVVAGEIVPRARRKLAGQPVPNVAAAITMFQRASGVAGVRLNRKAYPWIGGAEFGAKKFRQFRPWVGNRYTANRRPGYMVGEAMEEVEASRLVPRLQQEMVRAIVRRMLRG